MEKKDWIITFVTLISTMLGVTAAFMLDNWKEEAQLIEAKNLALANLHDEIRDNRDSLQDNYAQLTLCQEGLISVVKLRDENGRMIATPEELSSFQASFPEMFTKGDSMLIEKNKYAYSGDLYIDLDVLTLSSIAWETAHSMQVFQEFGYDCLYDLHGVYRMQESTLEEAELITSVIKKRDLPELITTLEIVRQFELQLSEVYEKVLERPKGEWQW
jgi:hypothetical protein